MAAFFRLHRRDFVKMTSLVALAHAFGSSSGRTQNRADVEVGVIVPLSGLYARPGQVMRMGAEMGVEDINAQGEVKAHAGANMKLVIIDCGDTTEKAKNAAQRMVTEVTKRAHLPVLTLSYSDLITARGFKYVFQTSATAASQAEQALPVVVDLATRSTGGKPKSVAIVTDNTAASVASVKPMRERLLKELGLELVVDETFTPPLSDATPLVQRVRSARPDFLFLLPTAVADDKILVEKLSEMGLN